MQMRSVTRRWRKRMTEMSEDPVLETLLAVRAELSPDLDEDLVRSCYAIERQHQFSRDRALPSQALDRLIDEHVKQAMIVEGGAADK